MKKFLCNLLGFGTVLFIIGLIKLAIYPNHNYSYPILNAKLEYLKDHQEYNLYFIGSSKINNQINCKLLDKTLPELKSYNLGANAGFNLENFQTLDYILQHEEFKPKYIVLELQDKIKVTRVNMDSPRSFGSFNYANTLFALKFHLQVHDIKQMLFTINSFVLNVFHYQKHADRSDVELQKNYFVTKEQGFTALELSKANEKRLTGKELEKEIERRLHIYNNDNDLHEPNPVLINRFHQIAEKCEQRGIKLILLIPGPAEPDAKSLQTYEKKLKIPVIDLLSPTENPEFYLLENRWDYGHLNGKGANILTEKLAKKLELIVK